MIRKASVLFFVVFALFAVGCSGGGGMSTKMPVDEAKALNASLSQAYNDTFGKWDASQASAATIAQVDIEPQKLAIVDFKNMMQSCVTTAPEALQAEAKTAQADAKVSAAEAQAIPLVGYEHVKGCGTDQLEGLKASADADVAAFYEEKFKLVDTLRMDLGYILPKNIEILVTSAPQKALEAAELLAKAEASLAAVENNPLASAEQKTKAKADYATIQAEVDAVKATAEKIPTDLANLPADVATLFQQIVSDIENFGGQS